MGATGPTSNSTSTLETVLKYLQGQLDVQKKTAASGQTLRDYTPKTDKWDGKTLPTPEEILSGKFSKTDLKAIFLVAMNVDDAVRSAPESKIKQLTQRMDKNSRNAIDIGDLFYADITGELWNKPAYKAEYERVKQETRGKTTKELMALAAEAAVVSDENAPDKPLAQRLKDAESQTDGMTVENLTKLIKAETTEDKLKAYADILTGNLEKEKNESVVKAAALQRRAKVRDGIMKQRQKVFEQATKREPDRELEKLQKDTEEKAKKAALAQYGGGSEDEEGSSSGGSLG